MTWRNSPTGVAIRPGSFDRRSESFCDFRLVCSLLGFDLRPELRNKNPATELKGEIMKRAFLIIVGALVLAGFLIADIGWPKASVSKKVSAAASAAEAASTAQPETRFVPKGTGPSV